MQKFHGPTLPLSVREGSGGGGLAPPLWRTAAKSEGSVRLSGQALMLLGRRPRRVTIVLELLVLRLPLALRC